MTLTLATFSSAIFYLIAGALQTVTLSGGIDRRTLVMTLGIAGVALHTLAVYLVLHTGNGIQLGLFPVSSLVAWMVAALVLMSCLRKPLANLLVAVFPIAAVAVILAQLIPVTSAAKPYDGGVISHILTSILAYSILAIATLQAFLLAAQEYQLKHHHTRGIVQSLPPLQLMESLLFEMIWAGLLLLTASLITGVIFVEDIFAQHLVHKTVLSIAAWIVYAVLLWGRHQQGWRGRYAIRWTLGGFAFLVLAYFGSKFAVELILAPG